MIYPSSTQSNFNRRIFAKWPRHRNFQNFRNGRDIETFKIFEMAATSKLSKFSLEEICKYFELDTSTIKQRRKKPTLTCWMLT